MLQVICKLSVNQTKQEILYTEVCFTEHTPVYIATGP